MTSLILGHRHSKESKFSGNSRKLLISAPISRASCEAISPTLRSPLAGPVVVLKAKYTFESQGSPEISVKKNELLMPIEKREDGWIYVQCLDRDAKGLIPCLYAEIVVNDPKKPVTMAWFSESKATSPKINERVDRIIISQVTLTESHRLCYKVEAVLGSDRVVKCCKLYEDFENLVSLINNRFSPKEKFLVPAQLVSHVSPIKCSDSIKMDILTVAQNLNFLLQDLKKFLATKECLLLVDFLLEDESFLKAGASRHRNTMPAPIIVDLLNKSAAGQLSVQRSQSFCPTAPLSPTKGSNRKRCASSSKENLISYKSSNMEYLMYLRHMQTSPSKNTTSTVCKSESITSLLSLIESYDVTSWDVYDDCSYTKNSAHPQNVGLHLESKDCKHSAYAPLCAEPTAHILLSSGKDAHMSDTTTSSRESSLSQLFEPVTPPLEHQSLSSIKIPDHMPQIEKEYDLSPLQPQMHREFLGKVLEK